jgi:hypothetical protein
MLLMGFASDDGGFFLLVGAGGRMLREPSIWGGEETWRCGVEEKTEGCVVNRRMKSFAFLFFSSLFIYC